MIIVKVGVMRDKQTAFRNHRKRDTIIGHGKKNEIH
jgi:hypothetical protein